MPPWVYTLIAVAVTLVWVIANLVAIISATPVDSSIHWIMGAVVGAMFGAQSLAHRRDRNRDG